MFDRYALTVFSFALLFSAGCQRAHQAEGTRDAEVKALHDAEVAEEQAWISKDLEKALSSYADDAVVMNPNTPAMIGKDQIRASMKVEFADPTATAQYQIINVEVAQSGELGYTQGTSSVTSADPATKKPVTERGKWLTIRRKQADGSWKIVVDMYNSDVPLPSPGK